MDTGLLQDNQLQPVSHETGMSVSLFDVPAVPTNVSEASSCEHGLSRPGSSAHNLDIDDLMPELGKHSPTPPDKH